MPVYVYDKSGVVEMRPQPDWKQVGNEVSEFNRQNPSSRQRVHVGPEFPPYGFRLDAVNGELKKMSLQERIDAGLDAIPDGYSIQSGALGEVFVAENEKIDVVGRVVPKSAQELVSEGLLTLDSATQKIENERIVPKTRAEQLSEGNLSLTDIREQEIQRLRAEIELHFATAKTTNGYRLDTLARQKAAVSLQYRQTDNSDPQKAALLSSKVIYPDAMTDEILAKVESVQTAYDQAKAAIEVCFTQSKPVADFEAVKIATYL